MFKRTNKITALLVAAASVMSIVPAMAADSARLGTKDGTITNAIAYKDGKYAYRGYRTDDDSEAIYYNAGDKDKPLSDVEDADLISAFDDKYAFANDGNDQYLVDLSAGTVSDESTPEDQADTAATKLKTALKKTDRYGSSVTVEASNLGYDKAATEIYTGALPGPKFAETWYAYSVGGNSQENAVDGQLFGFTNATGKYIDASNLANVYAYSSYKGKNVKIEEYNDYNDDTKLEAKLLGQPTVLTQDKDYIYAVVKVAILDSNNPATAAGTTTDAAVDSKYDLTSKTTVHTYLQKIAKAQGDNKDDALLPKSVDSYELDNKSYLDNGDVEDAYTAILKDDDGYDAADNQYRVKGDAFYVTRIKEGKVKVFALKMTKIKENTVKIGGTKISDDKVDAYVVKKTGDADQDIPDNVKEAAVSIDVDGNTWAINEGKIYKFTGTDKTTVFTCDRSLDKLSVYDETSLIAWDGTDDGNVYTTVKEGKAETATEAPATTVTPAKVGWDKLADGTWNFYDATGTKLANKWANAGGAWYFLKADGAMATGWYNDNGTWYFLAGSGAMKTGWVQDGS
jgi:hypothetical protein